MITQTATGLNSRSEANPYNSGFLPLITAPMYSVIDETNYQIFLDNKIRVCLPRDRNYVASNKDGTFITCSLNDFLNLYVSPYINVQFFSGLEFAEYVCIDTANGNMPALHEAIRKAKEIHGDNLVIMAGNVASVEAFVELAKTGVDYIRVGIGGGGGCNTTSNTGVGQENLEELVNKCLNQKLLHKTYCMDTYLPYKEFTKKHGFVSEDLKQKWANIAKVKIVADGISSYIKQCEKEYGFNDNGYAAINKLLFAGADLVMIGKLFAQCIESAGKKGYFFGNSFDSEISNSSAARLINESFVNSNDNPGEVRVKYSGMSTQEEQGKYKKPNIKIGDIFYLKEDTSNKQPIKCTMIEHGFTWGIVQNCSNCKETGFLWDQIKNSIKPSEGSVQWIPVRWTLTEWLHGSDNQDQYPYLMGWINSIKSAMSYTNKTTL